MLIVGEKINTSRKRVQTAVADRDAEFIGRLAREQAEAGADYIDVNAGTFVNEEPACLCWLVETVQNAVDLPLALDSPDPNALAEAARVHRGVPMINSISMEKERLEAMMPLVSSTPCHIVALCMGRAGMPTTIEERVEVGAELIRTLTGAGVPLDHIHVDPLVQPVSVDTNMGLAALGAIERIMEEFPGVRTICGLSNVSYGLPERRLINRSFLALAMGRGLSGAILDPTDRELLSILLAADMVLGRDEYCERYITAYQAGKIGSKDR